MWAMLLLRALVEPPMMFPCSLWWNKQYISRSASSRICHFLVDFLLHSQTLRMVIVILGNVLCSWSFVWLNLCVFIMGLLCSCSYFEPQLWFYLHFLSLCVFTSAFPKRRFSLPLLREQQVTVLKKVDRWQVCPSEYYVFASISNPNCDFTLTFFHFVFLPLFFQNEGSVYSNS